MIVIMFANPVLPRLHPRLLWTRPARMLALVRPLVTVAVDRVNFVLGQVLGAMLGLHRGLRIPRQIWARHGGSFASCLASWRETNSVQPNNDRRALYEPLSWTLGVLF